MTRVIGVASFGEAGSCPSSRDGYNRVDQFLGMIDEAIIASGGCPEATDETCNSIDDDCDGTIDEGCARIGEACETDGDCAFAQLPERFEPLERPVFCGETAGGRVCTRACDPLTPREGCGEIPHPFLDTTETFEGVYCRRTDGCEGLCVAGEAGSGGDGDSCERDTDCASLFCTDPGDGRERCLTPCRGGEGICFAGEVCAASGGACGGCLPPEMVSGARALGEPCADAADCGSGVCFEDGPFRYCSRACEDDAGCAAGFHCRSGSCARGARSATGERCVSDEDCVDGDRCAEDGSLRWCTHACTTGTSCPEGFLCVGNECVPDLRLDGEACSDDDQCISGVCGDAGDRRRCLRPCGPGAPCPSALECRRLGDSPDATCAPPFDPEPSGCTVTPAPRTTPLWLLLLLALPILRPRPRNP